MRVKINSKFPTKENISVTVYQFVYFFPILFLILTTGNTKIPGLWAKSQQQTILVAILFFYCWRLYSRNDVIYKFIKLQKLGIYCNFIYLQLIFIMQTFKVFYRSRNRAQIDLGFADLIGCRTLSLAPNLVCVFVIQAYFLIFR